MRRIPSHLRGAFDQRRQMLGRGAVAGGGVGDSAQQTHQQVQAAWSRLRVHAVTGAAVPWPKRRNAALTYKGLDTRVRRR